MQQRIRKRRSHRLVAATGCLLSTWILICGCDSGPQQYTSGEEAAVQETISNLSDSRGASLEDLFVEGAVPDEATRKQFAPYMPSAAKVSVSGDIATVDVEFEELATGEIKGPTEWTLEKVGDVWKIKTCPLP